MLKKFMTGLNFVRMRQDTGVIAGGIPDGSFGRAIGEAGQQYAIYVHHSTVAKGNNRYEVSEMSQKFEAVLDLPPGSYRLEWIRPADLAVLGTQTIEKHGGGKIKLAPSPEHKADIAMRIRSRR